MKISVDLLPRSIVSGTAESDVDIAVVIDVLRATSVMATALASGAKQILTCSEVDKARSWKETLGSDVLLCGERKCQPIEGFDLGNSPSEYTPEVVGGRTLVMTTTNGTRAIHAVQEAKCIVTASFLNFDAVVRSIQGAGTVRLVCAGTDGEVTGEDVLLAGALAESCQNRFQAEVCGDDSATAIQAWLAFTNNQLSLGDELRKTAGGQNLVRSGFGDDMCRCAEIDSLSVVPTQVSGDPPTFTASIAS